VEYEKDIRHIVLQEEHERTAREFHNWKMKTEEELGISEDEIATDG
jgi:hypothetical protein